MFGRLYRFYTDIMLSWDTLNLFAYHCSYQYYRVLCVCVCASALFNQRYWKLKIMMDISGVMRRFVNGYRISSNLYNEIAFTYLSKQRWTKPNFLIISMIQLSWRLHFSNVSPVACCWAIVLRWINWMINNEHWAMSNSDKSPFEIEKQIYYQLKNTSSKLRTRRPQENIS